MKKGFLLLLVSVVLTSCSTVLLNSLQYDQLSPAVVSLPQDIKQIAIIDRLNIDVPANQQSLAIKSKDYVELLGAQLADSDYFDDVVLCDSDISSLDRDDNVLKPLEQIHVQELTADLNADLIVSFENISARLIQSLYLPVVETKAVVRLYAPNRKGVLRNIALCDTVSWSVDQDNLSWSQMAYDVADYTASSLAKQLAPYWEPVQRYYYVGGNVNFRDAAIFVDKGDWDTAVELWNEMLPTAKGTLRLQTLFNLIVAKEMRGDLDGALNDCEDLVSKCPEKTDVQRLATYYQSVLMKRIAEQQMLNLQMKRFN